jgi:hypothetical protein
MQGASVTAFSISDIGGALGDDGQNYSNLAELVSALGFTFTERTHMGCPDTRASEPAASAAHSSV